MRCSWRRAFQRLTSPSPSLILQPPKIGTHFRFPHDSVFNNLIPALQDCVPEKQKMETEALNWVSVYQEVSSTAWGNQSFVHQYFESESTLTQTL